MAVSSAERRSDDATALSSASPLGIALSIPGKLPCYFLVRTKMGGNIVGVNGVISSMQIQQKNGSVSKFTPLHNSSSL
jgi:hypothetical protein